MPAASNYAPMARRRGHTLVELMLVVALVAILLALGAPGFIGLYHRNLLDAQAERLISDLYHARSEAIKRNLPVVVCRSPDEARCASGGGSRSDWGMGWISFVNADGDRVRDPGEALLRVGSPVPEPLSLEFNHWWRLTFLPDGRAGAGTFTLCDRSGNERRITVYLSGRIRLARGSAAPPGCPAS